MTISEIKELIEVVRKAGILELEVKSGENSVRIRGVAGTSQEVFVPAFATAAHAEAAAASAAAKDEDQERDIVVKSPIVGTFYDASAPGAGSSLVLAL
jgi:acetyl-CoA carboxylase biotin carboxyl carrier protein